MLWILNETGDNVFVFLIGGERLKLAKGRTAVRIVDAHQRFVGERFACHETISMVVRQCLLMMLLLSNRFSSLSLSVLLLFLFFLQRIP